MVLIAEWETGWNPGGPPGSAGIRRRPFLQTGSILSGDRMVYSYFEQQSALPGDNSMKRITAVALMSMGLAAIGMAAEFTGFVEDTSCSTKPGMKGNAACAKSCVKGGSPAVLMTADGTVYKIANQDKIVSHAGETVTVTADLKGDTLTINTVK
jgi:hypothetical protein